MPTSDSMRRLAKKWTTNAGWPRRLEWLELFGLRGWDGQRIEFPFPIIAIVGENGSGKSTLLQAAASMYKSDDRKKTWFASDFFPDTAWEKVRNATIRCGYQHGTEHRDFSIRKPTTRWLGNADRPSREVEYIDLTRIQPVSERVGYAKIAKTKHTEKSATAFDAEKVRRLSEVMGREYDGARMALSNLDAVRTVPVITKKGTNYSGFHQGSGETTIVELLQYDLPRYGLVLIDEIESSLHPRAQRRLIGDLAEICRTKELQIILTTHSPYVLEELPLEARMYILDNPHERKEVMNGISPQFAMTKMDDQFHPDCDLYVEDQAAKTMLGELLAKHAREAFVRCDIIPCGATSVCHSLGQMVHHKRFRRPTCVFVDGDGAEAPGCLALPGGDAPERVVFNALKATRWEGLWPRIGRDSSLTMDACTRAMTLDDHHLWVRTAASSLQCSGDTLWQAMCAQWATGLTNEEVRTVINAVEDVLPGAVPSS